MLCVTSFRAIIRHRRETFVRAFLVYFCERFSRINKKKMPSCFVHTTRFFISLWLFSFVRSRSLSVMKKHRRKSMNEWMDSQWVSCQVQQVPSHHNLSVVYSIYLLFDYANWLTIRFVHESSFIRTCLLQIDSKSYRLLWDEWMVLLSTPGNNRSPLQATPTAFYHLMVPTRLVYLRIIYANV